VALALIVMLSGVHVTLPVGAWPVTVPLPALALAAELGVCAVLGWLIARAAGCPRIYSRRIA
jgi:hypothetical protein